MKHLQHTACTDKTIISDKFKTFFFY